MIDNAAVMEGGFIFYNAAWRIASRRLKSGKIIVHCVKILSDRILENIISDACVVSKGIGSLGETFPLPQLLQIREIISGGNSAE